jgi:hypothetical protein
MWKFKDSAAGAGKQENLTKAKAMFESLPGEISHIKFLEIGIGITEGDQFYDLALNSTFDSQETLVAYQQHPAHLSVVEFLRAVQSSKVVIDYLI